MHTASTLDDGSNFHVCGMAALRASYHHFTLAQHKFFFPGFLFLNLLNHKLWQSSLGLASVFDFRCFSACLTLAITFVVHKYPFSSFLSAK
jgi:hypothetical protein